VGGRRSLSGADSLTTPTTRTLVRSDGTAATSARRQAIGSPAVGRGAADDAGPGCRNAGGIGSKHGLAAGVGPYKVKDLRGVSGPSPFVGGCPGVRFDGMTITGRKLEPTVTGSPLRAGHA
jgi:hypothetical protein